MTKKTKLLLSTDSAAIHTGLANTTRTIFTRLMSSYPNQYEIHQLGWFNYQRSENIPWKIYSTATKNVNGKIAFDETDRYGQRSFEGILEKVQPDIVWTYGDMWCFEHILNSLNRNKFRLAVYYTIDGYPYWGKEIKPGHKSDWGTKLKNSDRVIVMSEWGKRVLSDSCPELTPEDIDVIYHPINTELFLPLRDSEKLSIRDTMYDKSVPRDAFIMGWVGRNQFRKMNFKMWEVLHYLIYGDYIQCSDCGRITVKEYDHAAMRSRKVGDLSIYDPDYDYSVCWHCKSENITHGKPIDDIYLWMHMNKQDPGWEPDLHATMWGVSDRVIYTAGVTPSKGLDHRMLAKLMASWDAMLYLSGGEGFGIPAFESLSCGVPVIYTNYSSHADFCKKGGLPVRVNYIPELNFSIQRSIADTNHAVEQCLRAYNDRNLLKELGKSGREFAQTKDIDTIVKQWHKLFQSMMEKPLPISGQDKIYSNIL